MESTRFYAVDATTFRPATRVARTLYDTRLGEKLRIIFPSVSFLLFERER